MRPELFAASFDDVLPIWRDLLWPDRKSPILAVSPIGMDRRYDGNIADACPSFFVLRDSSGTIRGTNSGYATGGGAYRSRGLYLDPAFRGKGFASILLGAVRDQALREQCSVLWSFPRASAMDAYARFGFERASDWFTDGMEFGPNCIATLRLVPPRS